MGSSIAQAELTAVVWSFLFEAGFLHCAMLRIAPVGMTMGPFVTFCEGYLAMSL
jgi:hypothetical protein